MKDTYFNLVIVADSENQDIWLADNEGHFVQKETGELSTGLIPGKYVVEFGLGNPQYEIELTKDSKLTEAELKSKGPVPRRVPTFDEY